MPYDLQTPNAPRLVGAPLKLVARLSRTPLGSLVFASMAANLGLPRFRHASAGDAPLAPFPILPEGDPKKSHGPLDLAALADRPTEAPGFHFESAADLRRAYREGATDPVEVAERAISAIADSEALSPPLRVFFVHRPDEVLEQARASRERWKKGELLGPLDGVPVAIKDEVDQAGYPTSLGTAFRARRVGPAASDATVVARLRAAGAVLLGKANMTEIGINPIGHQPHHGTARNPYDDRRFTGGSSSGPGVAVASGICPIALGADGGGSIRHPASFCGVVGIKATFGRVSEHGVPPVCWSVAHLGPLASTARDCALAYAVMAGPDEHDRHSQHQPPVDLDQLENGDLTGIRLGVFTPWFDDADPGVVRACKKMLKHLESRGATVKEIEIEGLDTLRVAHLITIASEMLASQEPWLEEHIADYATDVQLLLASIRRFDGHDYVHAQRHRYLACQQFARLLTEVDAIVTPTNGCVAPIIRPGAERGESDLALLSKVMRYVVPANMTGLPAISFPAGYDDDGMPVGFHAMGRAWEESLLLRLAVAAEDGVERRRPRHWYSLLGPG